MTLASTGLNIPTLSKYWMGACDNYAQSEWVMVGLPYDGTCTNRPGARFGPEALRAASWGIETYSPYQDNDLEDTAFFDAGELQFPFGNREATLNIINQAARKVLAAKKKWLGIGGEHLVTLPVVQAYVEKYPDLGILHFDAHADLRDEFIGEKLSHATVLRRCVELISPDRLVQIGIRSGPREEFAWMKEHRTLIKSQNDIPYAHSKLSGRPVFLTVDLDVLDPSILPGTGTPEAGGMMFNEFVSWLLSFKSLNIVGADVVELAPKLDSSGISEAVAAKVVREILLLGLAK